MHGQVRPHASHESRERRRRIDHNTASSLVPPGAAQIEPPPPYTRSPLLGHTRGIQNPHRPQPEPSQVASDAFSLAFKTTPAIDSDDELIGPFYKACYTELVSEHEAEDGTVPVESSAYVLGKRLTEPPEASFVLARTVDRVARSRFAWELNTPGRKLVDFVAVFRAVEDDDVDDEDDDEQSSPGTPNASTYPDLRSLPISPQVESSYTYGQGSATMSYAAAPYSAYSVVRYGDDSVLRARPTDEVAVSTYSPPTWAHVPYRLDTQGPPFTWEEPAGGVYCDGLHATPRACGPYEGHDIFAADLASTQGDVGYTSSSGTAEDMVEFHAFACDINSTRDGFLFQPPEPASHVLWPVDIRQAPGQNTFYFRPYDNEDRAFGKPTSWSKISVDPVGFDVQV